MIKVNSLLLKYGEQKVLDIKKLDILENGLYIISGVSGCGKTSFLNIVAGLNNKFEGVVEINGNSVKHIEEKDLHSFRRDNIAYCHQDDVLFDNFSVRKNIEMTLYFYNLSKRQQNLKVEEIARKLNIYNLLRKKCKNLSGGERKRVNLARTIVSNKNIYLFDEPTSSLDKINTKNVFDLLYSLSASAIVLVVTHDLDYIEQYKHFRLAFDYGKVSIHRHEVFREKEKLISTQFNNLKTNDFNHKTKINLSKEMFFSKIKRNMLGLFTFTFSLTAISLVFLITGGLTSQVKGVFSTNFDENTVVYKTKMDTNTSYISGLNRESTQVVGRKYNAKLASTYLDNLNDFFETNYTQIVFNGMTINKDIYNVDSFNSIIFEEEINKTIFKNNSDIELDEVVLGLTRIEYGKLQNDLGLKISNNENKLLGFLGENEVYLSLYVSNPNWDYEDEQLFRVVGFAIVDANIIIHSNPLFSENLFETQMRLKSTYNYYNEPTYPWTLKKLHYLFKMNNSNILNDSILNSNYVLQRAYKEIFPGIERFEISLLDHRIMIFSKPINYIDLNQLVNDDPTAMLLVNNSYCAIESAMMVGFTKNFLISSNREELEETITFDEHQLIKNNYQISDSEYVYNLNYLNSLAGKLSLKNIEQFSNKKLLVEEVAVSKGLFKKLYGETTLTNQKLYLGAEISSSIDEEYIRKDYQTRELNIVEVVEDKGLSIYQHSYYPLAVYKDLLNLPFYNYLPNGVVSLQKELKNIGSSFTFSYPYKDFVTNLNETTTNINFLIGFIGSHSFVVALVIMFVILFMMIDDYNKQFKTLFLFGVSKRSIMQTVIYLALIYGGISLVTSMVQSLFVSLLLSNQILQVPLDFATLLLSYLITIIFTAFGIFSICLLLAPRVAKINTEFANKQLL